MLISQLYLYGMFYALMHNENSNNNSINSEEYYAKHARDLLKWDKEFTKIYNNDIRNPEWFADGMLNACYNTIDRHAERTPDKLAIIYDDNGGRCYKYTFKQCLIEIMKVANFLQAATKSQKELAYVAIYMQTSPQLIFTALACARLGLPHNIIFGGFSAENIALRIKDSKSKIVFTNYEVERETKKINFFETVASAHKILQKDNYNLDCIVVYDVDNLQINPDEIPVVLWNDLLRISPNIPDETNSDPEDIVKYATYNIVCKNTKNSKPLMDTFTDLNLDKFIPCIPVHAEHPLYCLYTSGSTGKPKGLVHSTGGYLFYAAFTTKVAYNITDDSIFLSTADLGWIAGHTNSLYGTLPLGCTIVIMSGSPVYPDLNRLFRMIEQYKVTHLFTAPTVIRILQQKLTNLEVGFKNKSLLDIYKEMPTSSENFGLPATDPAREILSIKKDLPYEKFIYQDKLSDDEMLIYNPQSFYRSNKGFFANGYDLSSLKLVSYAGEQLSKDTYLWWRKTFGPFIPLLTSYWQTEAGSILLSNHYNKTYPIPESTGVPFFGLEVTIASSIGNNQGSILVSGSWPGVARTILNDHERYINTYYKLHKGFYYTGDAGITKNGYFFIQGRDDDVVKVAGHRLSTSEIESACCAIPQICEAAAIGVNDNIHGQVIAVFCVKRDYDDDCTKQDVINAIRNKIGPIVRVKEVYFVLELPKTRAGKIMRRILRNIVENNEIGDLSTCLNIECISQIYISCSTKPKRTEKCEPWISI